MALNETFTQRKSEKIDIEEGIHTGLLQSIIHLGIQKTEYKGEVKFKSQVLLSFELSDVIGGEGSMPAVLSMRVNETDSDKGGLVKAIRALSGVQGRIEGLKLSEQIGKPVAITVAINQNGNPKITALSALRASQKTNVKPLVRAPKLLLDADHIGATEMKDLPEWIQKIINERVDSDGTVSPDVDY